MSREDFEKRWKVVLLSIDCGVSVKLHRIVEGTGERGERSLSKLESAELYILAKSENRVSKERSMRRVYRREGRYLLLSNLDASTSSPSEL